jgi:predicted Fe-S protein YdhL (DUF1289 family)
MIDEEDIDKALHWLVKNADAAARARAERVYVDEYRKHLKARLMKACGEETAAAQEREAYASQQYADHLKVLRDAVQEDERFRWLTTAAEAKIEVWRSEQANARAQGKVG